MKRLIRKLLRESLLVEELRFNDGRLNKQGPNTIYMDNEPIVDFGIGQIGAVNIDGKTFSNSIYLQGGYNAAAQGRGYGTIGLKFIFDKLPKIENIIVQCYDTACPFWSKMGAELIQSKDVANSGKPLRTMIINRNSFMSKHG